MIWYLRLKVNLKGAERGSREVGSQVRRPALLVAWRDQSSNPKPSLA